MPWTQDEKKNYVPQSICTGIKMLGRGSWDALTILKNKLMSKCLKKEAKHIPDWLDNHDQR